MINTFTLTPVSTWLSRYIMSASFMWLNILGPNNNHKYFLSATKMRLHILRRLPSYYGKKEERHTVYRMRSMREVLISLLRPSDRI